MLTTVEFHVAVADPVAYAVRIVRKALKAGNRVLLTAPAPRLRLLDEQMWVAVEGEFLPHAILPRAHAAVARRSPVWLAPAAGGHADEPKVLINLGASAPHDNLPLERLVEVVADLPEELEQARSRWRQYRLLQWNPTKVFDGATSA